MKVGVFATTSLLSYGAIWLIACYQKYLSPHKGWSCAYRVLSGEVSCSQYAKNVIEEEGVFTAIPIVLARFKACRHAHLKLSARNDSRNRAKRRDSYADGVKKDAAAEACCAGCSLLSWLR